MAVIRNIATKQQPGTAINNLRKTERQPFNIQRAANKRLAAGGRRRPSNAIGNIRRKY